MSSRKRLSSGQIVQLVEGAEKIASVTGEKASEIVAWILGEPPNGGDEEDEEEPGAVVNQATGVGAE